MVVFGDSSSDVGRRYNAPSSFQFEEYGIGAFPWKRLYDGPESDVSVFHTIRFSDFCMTQTNRMARSISRRLGGCQARWKGALSEPTLAETFAAPTFGK